MYYIHCIQIIVKTVNSLQRDSRFIQDSLHRYRFFKILPRKYLDENGEFELCFNI